MSNADRRQQYQISILIKCIIFGILVCIVFPSVSAISSENKIIYDLPLFDNYGNGFSTWSGETAQPLGNALLKGKITLNNDKFNPGDKVKIILDLAFSATIISGKYGALMNELGYDTWMLKTDDFQGDDFELGDIKGEELMGIGKGQEIPPVTLRTVSHTYEYKIPSSAKAGSYDIYAFIEGSEYTTNPVTITITGDSYSNEKQTVNGEGFSFKVPAGWDISSIDDGKTACSPDENYCISATGSNIKGSSQYTTDQLQQFAHNSLENTGFQDIGDNGKSYIGNYYGWSSGGTIEGKGAWSWVSCDTNDMYFWIGAVYDNPYGIHDTGEAEILESFNFS